MEKNKYITKKAENTVQRFDLRLYDSEVKILNDLEKKTGLSKASILRKLINESDKIIFL